MFKDIDNELYEAMNHVEIALVSLEELDGKFEEKGVTEDDEIRERIEAIHGMVDEIMEMLLETTNVIEEDEEE